MKSAVAFLLVIISLSPLACSFEHNLEEEQRRLGNKSQRQSPSQRFAKYLSINDRCCGDDTSQCRCWVRNSKWFKRKWARSCSPGGSIKNKSSLVALAASNPKFSTLVKLVKRVGLVDVLIGEGPFTIFAPTNNAFNAIGKAALDALDDDTLTKILLYHVFPGAKVLSGALVAALTADGSLKTATALSKYNTADKEELTFVFEGTDIAINGDVLVNLDLLDFEAWNGVIHGIDGVISIPK